MNRHIFRGNEDHVANDGITQIVLTQEASQTDTEGHFFQLDRDQRLLGNNAELLHRGAIQDKVEFRLIGELGDRVLKGGIGKFHADGLIQRFGNGLGWRFCLEFRVGGRFTDGGRRRKQD